MKNAGQLIAAVPSLPTLSPTVAKLSAMLGDENSTAEDMEKVIRLDPALTANLLRMANSPIFGLRRKVESVRQAVVFLGTKRLYEAVVSASISKVIPKTIPGYDMDSNAFWVHSVAVGVMAESLARELGVPEPDFVYTGGLLHDMGKLLVGVYLTRKGSRGEELRAIEEGTLIEREKEVFGFDHTEAGHILANAWNLPDRICYGVRWHHRPEATPEGVDQTMVDLVHAANGLAHSIGFGGDVAELSRKVEESVIDRLGIKVQRLEAVASETMEQISDLGQQVGDPAGG